MFRKDRISSNKANKKKSKLRENIETIFSAVVIALIIRILIIEAYEIPTGSMIPTIIERDRLLVNKFIYGVRIPILGWKLPKFTSPDRGDIVVFHFPNYRSPGWAYELIDLITFGIFKLTNTHDHPKNYIKRAVGLPGDVISFKDQTLLINGKQITLSKKISLELMKDIEAINNPQANSNSFYADSDTRYYTEKANGEVYGKNDELLYSSKMANIEHIVQIEDLISENIPFIYVPKEGDKAEFSLITDSGLNKMVKVKVNAKYLGSLTSYNFSRYYSNILLDKMAKLKLDKTITYDFKDDYYFMMGDNRDSSHDSRVWGFVNERYIIGKPLIIFWPIERLWTSPN